MEQIDRQRILIVDDVELNRRMLAVALQEKYEILEAGNGKRALEILNEEKGKVSLILLDLVMPIMDGFRLLKYLQNDIRFCEIPVVLITAEASQENIMEGFRMGVKDVIAKPFASSVVCRRVEHLIQLADQRKHAPKGPASGTGVQSLPKKMALIVDDVALNRKMLLAILEENYQILEAQDGQEALDLSAKYAQEIAVVLLDIIMPVMDGVVFMKELHRRGLLAHVPVIAVTSEETQSKMEEMKECGISEVIHKPFHFDIIKNRVDYLVELAAHQRNQG